MANDQPPVERKDPFEGSGAEDIAPELKDQLEARERRRAKARKKKRPKGTYDLSLKLLDKVREVSKIEDVPQSDIVAWALIEFLERYEGGDVDFEDHKKPTRSLRYLYKLDLPSEWE